MESEFEKTPAPDDAIAVIEAIHDLCEASPSGLSAHRTKEVTKWLASVVKKMKKTPK